MNDFILTQTKEVVMTFEKTVTVTTEKLETVDALGRKQVQKEKKDIAQDHLCHEHIKLTVTVIALCHT